MGVRHLARLAIGPPSAHSSETDFGAEKVRSKPGTAPLEPTPRVPSSGSPLDRVAAGQHRSELFGPSTSVEAQLLRSVADPEALSLALAAVVVLGAFGDVLSVVALLSAPELSDREHAPSLSRERASCSAHP